MCEHLLSLLHIQKLGNPLEEIRLRALSNVISKYNLNLVDESNLENTKLLLRKLLEWFDFDRSCEHEKVLKLLIKILKYDKADLVLSEIGTNDLMSRINKIEYKIGHAYSALIQDIKECLKKVENESGDSNFLNYAFLNSASDIDYSNKDVNKNEKKCKRDSNKNKNDNEKENNRNLEGCTKISSRNANDCKRKSNQERNDHENEINRNAHVIYSNRNCNGYERYVSSNSNDLGRNEGDCERYHEVRSSCSQKSTYTCLSKKHHKENELVKNCNGKTETEQVENFTHKSTYKVQYFPWQHLVLGDKQVLFSVYDGLRYFDNKNSVLQSCQFFNEVILRDFPSEIFIQRPLILRTFLEVIANANETVRITVLKSLTRAVQCLKESTHFILNPALFNQKIEFYVTSTFFNNESDASERSECFQLHIDGFDADIRSDGEIDSCDHNLKKCQLSLPNFCFEILEYILPHLRKNCTQEETNYLVALCYETIQCLICNVKYDTWKSRTNLKEKMYKIFGLLMNLLKHHKDLKYILYITLLYMTINMLNVVRPPSAFELHEILPRGLQFELGSCITNFGLVLMFPQLHSEILKNVEQLHGQKEKEIVQDYKDLMIVLESMREAVRFIQTNSHFRSKMEKLECAGSALLSLDFHQNCDFIHSFFVTCLLNWTKSQLKDKDLKTRNDILIKLLSHSNDCVKVNIYKKINDFAMKMLGVHDTVSSMYDIPGDKMEFLFEVDILTEIICHGLNSSIVEVRKYSSEIIAHLLKSKYLMSDSSWNDFLKSLTPCLSLLQCYGDKSTTMGRCIVKLFDPDTAKSTGLPVIEILKGNIRFLFSKNNLTRDEAISRLFWLLSKEDSGGKRLPRMSVLIGLNLSGICSSVHPKEFTQMRQSFYDPSRLCDVLEMLIADNIEPSIRRSALAQINVMMDDVNLHNIFLEHKGLEIILQILHNCLIEKEFVNYPDSVMPIVDILRLLALNNVFVRQQLSSYVDLYYSVLRGLFLFSSDETFRRNAVELLCLLLYNDCILRVPPDKSVKCSISFPEIVISKMCLPFVTHCHWRHSKHLEPSTRKHLMCKTNCAKLLRVFWAIQWVGSLSDVMNMQPSDLKDTAHSPGIPDDLKITYKDIESLKKCSFGPSIKQTLYDIQNATNHEAVFYCLHKLHGYFLIYNIDKMTFGKGCKLVSSEATLSHMLWENSLERFMAYTPSCNLDEGLLLQVIQFLQVLLKSFKSGRLIDWIEKLLTDIHQPLSQILKNMGSENIGLKGRELRLGIIELMQQIVVSKSTLDTNKWFSHMELISDHLKLDNKKEFYNVAHIDWFISLLVDLTGKRSWHYEGKTKYVENLVTRILEIIIAFHCTKESTISFMGLNIVKNSILVLNHILSDSQMSVKEWEKLWFYCLSKIIGQMGDINHCWLLSLWFMRDPVARAAAFQLFVGFSTTPQSCQLLIDRLNIGFDQIWIQGLNVLFDENECSFVREKSALLLSNFAHHGICVSSGCLLQHLKDLNFFEEALKIISNFQWERTLSAVTLHPTKNMFCGQVMTTPSFVTTLCTLLRNLISVNPTKVAERIFQTGVLESLTRVLNDIPESTNICDRHRDCLDALQMYISVCRLLTLCMTFNCDVRSFMLQSQQSINCLYSMVNYSLFCEESKTITLLKNELWCEVLDLFSVLLVKNSDASHNATDKSGFYALNRSMTDNGTDHFISSLYIALCSDELELRSAVLRFFVNFFHQEMASENCVSVTDIFDRKISGTALKIATTYAWKAFKISSGLTNLFGIRVCDILTQMFLLSNECLSQPTKSSVADALGSLFVVCRSAQDFFVGQGSVESLILSLKQVCVKLNLESIEDLRKGSGKKRIDPLFVQVETIFCLINNLIYKNEKAKIAVADCALSAVVHKLWPWCVAKRPLFIVALKLLCTFTHSCTQGCRTLVMSTSLAVLGLKRSPGPATLMNSIMNQVTVEMDSISKTHDSQVLALCLQMLSNCCRVTECRSVIAKGTFLESFNKLHPNRKRQSCSEKVVEAWLKFLIVISCHQEGQLALTKNQDILDLLFIMSSSSETNRRIRALTILRNVCFHQLNRIRMLNCCSFLNVMSITLDSKRREEIQLVTVMIWALSCNSQKAKLILRSSGFEAKLAAGRRNCVVNEDMETADCVDLVLGMLKNK